MSLHTPEQTALQSRGYPVTGDAQTLAEWPLPQTLHKTMFIHREAERTEWILKALLTPRFSF